MMNFNGTGCLKSFELNELDVHKNKKRQYPKNHHIYRLSWVDLS